MHKAMEWNLNLCMGVIRPSSTTHGRGGHPGFGSLSKIYSHSRKRRSPRYRHPPLPSQRQHVVHSASLSPLVRASLQTKLKVHLRWLAHSAQALAIDRQACTVYVHDPLYQLRSGFEHRTLPLALEPLHLAPLAHRNHLGRNRYRDILWILAVSASYLPDTPPFVHAVISQR